MTSIWRRASRRVVLTIAVAALTFACVEVRPAVAPAGSIFPSVTAQVEPAPARPFVGLELEETVAGGLEEMLFLAGLHVAAVAPGSPAEAAGIRPGDVVVAAGGVELERIDQWDAVLDGATAGESLALTVERDEGLVDVEVDVVSRGAGTLPERRRFLERVKAKVVVESERTAVDGGFIAAARIVALDPSSPLRAAGLVEGDRVVAVDGRPVEGAGAFAAEMAARPFGDEVELDVIPVVGAERAEGRDVRDVVLFAPPRTLTALSVPVLFSFERDIEDDRTEFAFIDLWILALYDYRRDGETRRHRLLRFFEYETGVGALSDETRPAGRREEETP